MAGSSLTFLVVVIFVAAQLWGRGVPLTQTLFLCLFGIAQVFVGAVIWSICNRSAQIRQLELLAMGMVLGPLACTVLDQAILAAGSRGMGTPVAVVISSIVVARKKLWRTCDLSTDQPMALFSIFGAVLIGLAIDESFTTPALVIFLVAIVVQRMWHRPTAKYIVVAVASVLSGLVVRLTINLASMKGGVLLPLFYTASDDQIKSEQLSFSIAHWGLSSNSAAIDLPIKFHWLSLGWSGTFMHIGDVDPFVVTLHFVPLFGFVGIAALLVSLAVRCGLRSWGVIIAPFVLLAGMNGDNGFRFFFVLTTTNLIPHMWILGLILALLVFNSSREHRLLPLVALLPSAIILGKGPYGVVIGVAIIFLILPLSKSNHHPDHNLVRALLVSLGLMCISYFGFLRSPLTDTYYFSKTEFLERFPFPLITSNYSGFVALTLGCVVCMAFVLTRFAWVFQLSFNKTNHITCFVLGGSLAGIASFVLKQVGSETYFANASLTVSALGLFIVLARLELEIAEIPRSNIIGCGLFVLLASIVLRVLQAPVHIKFFGTFSVALLITVVLGAKKRTSFRNAAFASFAILPILIGISNLQFKPNQHFELVASDEIELYEWVRNNTDPKSIFITDRFLCADSIRCGTGMPVATAFTRRRFLIEGARTLTPTRLWDGPYPSQLAAAAKATLDFADQPTILTLQLLRAKGVTHAIISNGAIRNWRSFTGIKMVYSNEAFSVFTLKESFE